MEARREQMQRASEAESREERLVPRWAFVTQLFNHVFAADRRPIAHLGDRRIELYRKLAFGSVIGLMMLFAILFGRSLLNNRSLLQQVNAAAAAEHHLSHPSYQSHY